MATKCFASATIPLLNVIVCLFCRNYIFFPPPATSNNMFRSIWMTQLLCGVAADSFLLHTSCVCVACVVQTSPDNTINPKHSKWRQQLLHSQKFVISPKCPQYLSSQAQYQRFCHSSCPAPPTPWVCHWWLRKLSDTKASNNWQSLLPFPLQS